MASYTVDTEHIDKVQPDDIVQYIQLFCYSVIKVFLFSWLS